jgi:hypothetical protein
MSVANRNTAIFGRAALTLMMIAIAAAFGAQRFPYAWDDSANYIAMAQGRPALMPWAGRILLPDLAAFLSRTFAIRLNHGFEMIAAFSFVLWIAIVGERWRTSIWTPVFLITPLIVTTFQAAYITDGLHMALVAVFLLMMRHNYRFAAALLMIVMYTARESSLLLAFISAGVLVWNRNIFGSILVILGWLIGSYVVHRATANAYNVHHMPEIIYLFTKMPANFLRDWLGIRIWTNGYAWCNHPFFVTWVPRSFHLGVISKIGFCTPSIVEPLSTMASYVTSYGVLPAALIASLRANRIPPDKKKEISWVIAFTYGALMTLLGPIAGPPADRAIGFGWPLFLIAIPAICVEVLTWRIAALQIIASWAPLLFSSLLGPPESVRSFIGISLAPIVSALSLAVGSLANAVAYRTIRATVAQTQDMGALTFTPNFSDGRQP